MTPRLTPVDILNKRFSRRFSGYHAAETDEFMRQVAADMESVLLENAAQREQIAALDREMARYRSLENTMRDALIMGQKSADDIRDAARAQAAAQLEAAQQKVDALHEQTERLRLDRRRMAHEMKALLESQIAWLDYEIVRAVPQTGEEREEGSIGNREQGTGNRKQQDAPQLAPADVSIPALPLPVSDTEEATDSNGASAVVPISAFGLKPVPSVTTAEYAALTELITASQDRTASRNGASDAVPPENA